jgi:hypothetical protein
VPRESSSRSWSTERSASDELEPGELDHFDAQRFRIPLVSADEAAAAPFLETLWLTALDLFLPRLAVSSDRLTPHAERTPTSSKDSLLP